MQNIEKPAIRRAGTNDVEALLPLVQAYRVFYGRQPSPGAEREYVESQLRNPNAAIYLAMRDGDAIGFLQMFRTHSTVHLANMWILEDLFVDPGARRGGVATLLLQKALEHARGDRAAGMFLETANDNLAAQSVYERNGWTREGRFLKYNAPI